MIADDHRRASGAGSAGTGRGRGPALMLLAIALVASACASRGGSGITAQTPRVNELHSVSDLQDRFNADPGTIRLILLLSPT